MIGTFSRYVVVQVAAYAIDLGLFLLLTTVLGPVWANVCSKGAAGAFAFVSHRRITFRVHKKGNGRLQLIKYILLLLLNIPVSTGVLALLMRWISNVVLAKVISDILCVGVTFLLSRYAVFTRARDDVRL